MTVGRSPRSIALCIALAMNMFVQSAHARPDEPASETTDVDSRVTPEPDSTTLEKSRAAFRKGVVQLRAQDWAGARASFEEAWALVQHPSILLNLGIARLRTDDPVLAEQDLVRFLSEDPGAAPEELASARDALAEARAQVGTLRILVSPASARVVVDGKPFALRALSAGEGIAEARLRAGQHIMRVEADGFMPDERLVEVPAKSQTDVNVRLGAVMDHAKLGHEPSPAKGTSTRRIVGWSLAGLGAGAAVASGVMGLRAISLASDYNDATNHSSFQNADVKSEGIGFRTGADIALVAAVLAGAGALLLLVTDIGTSRGANVVWSRSVRTNVDLSRGTSFGW